MKAQNKSYQVDLELGFFFLVILHEAQVLATVVSSNHSFIELWENADIVGNNWREFKWILYQSGF